jgi:type III restriction enzyme
MALHPDFPTSPYVQLLPSQRWFPADEALREKSYEKLLPPLVAKIREAVFAWRSNGYAGASATTITLLKHWFETEHLVENADRSLSAFRYYFAQREAVESVIWLHEIKQVHDKFDMIRFDSSGAVSTGMFAEDWPRYVLKMATGAGKTKVLSLLIEYYRPRSPARRLRWAESLLQRSYPARQRCRWTQLVR